VAKAQYYVDWDDQHYPKIRDIKYAYPGETGTTFAQAKAEIIEHFQNVKKHAQTIINDTRTLRVEDLVAA